jgi:hypothetical protein
MNAKFFSMVFYGTMKMMDDWRLLIDSWVKISRRQTQGKVSISPERY